MVIAHAVIMRSANNAKLFHMRKIIKQYANELHLCCLKFLMYGDIHYIWTSSAVDITCTVHSHAHVYIHVHVYMYMQHCMVSGLAN